MKTGIQLSTLQGVPTSPYINKQLCIIFAYAPAGLGHLRVTYALKHGLPEDADPILLPDRTGSVSTLHRLTSNTAIGKKILEWSQYGRGEDFFTKLYRRMLRSDAKEMEDKLFEIFKERITLPTTLLIVCTHFGIAHQVSVIKKRLEKRARIKVKLVVQVTDDSPQKLWYIPNADLIFVPSNETKRSLRRYAKNEDLDDSKLVVIPYPQSPRLQENLLPAAKRHKAEQYDPDEQTVIHMSIPISGAGVGTTYASALIKKLHKVNDRFHFHVIGKRTWYTEMFLEALEHKEYVSVYSSHSDRQIIEVYDQAFDTAVISLEVTKPSEQAFKALLSPKQVGGVILLFTEPVGRQEYDNLLFLRRHKLIPLPDEQEVLFEAWKKEWKANDTRVKELFSQAEHWRGIQLPKDPQEAASFITWCQSHRLFAKMMECSPCSRGDNECRVEVSATGVQQFWKTVETLL